MHAGLEATRYALPIIKKECKDIQAKVSLTVSVYGLKAMRTSFAGMKQTDLAETSDGRISFDFVCNEASDAAAPPTPPTPPTPRALAAERRVPVDIPVAKRPVLSVWAAHAPPHPGWPCMRRVPGPVPRWACSQHPRSRLLWCASGVAQSIYRVAFGADYGKDFCFITQDRKEMTFRCYAFGCKSKKIAGQIADATASACQRVFNTLALLKAKLKTMEEVNKQVDAARRVSHSSPSKVRARARAWPCRAVPAAPSAQPPFTRRPSPFTLHPAPPSPSQHPFALHPLRSTTQPHPTPPSEAASPRPAHVAAAHCRPRALRPTHRKHALGERASPPFGACPPCLVNGCP